MRQKKRRNGQFAVAISQFKRNKLAMIGLTILIVIALACIFQGVISPYDYAEQNITELHTSYRELEKQFTLKPEKLS